MSRVLCSDCQEEGRDGCFRCARPRERQAMPHERSAIRPSTRDRIQEQVQRDYEQFGWLFLVLLEDGSRTCTDLVRTTGIERYIVDDVIYALIQYGKLRVRPDSKIEVV